MAEKTIVYLRSMEVPAAHWEAQVLYDVWGSPYVKPGQGGVGASETVLRRGGKTNYTCLYGTEWRHKSGPPVTFGDRPGNPFDNMDSP